MIRTVAIFDMTRRTVKDGDLLVRVFHRIGGYLRHDCFQSLPYGRRSQIIRERPVGLENQARFLFRPGRATFDEAADGEAVIVAIDQLTSKLAFFIPAELLEASI